MEEISPTQKIGAARLKRTREAAGYKTAADFIRKWDLVGSTYRAHEAATRGITRDAAKKYGNMLGVNFLWLMGEGTDPDDPENVISVQPGIDSPYGTVHDIGTTRPERDATAGRSERTVLPPTEVREMPVYASVPGAGGGWVVKTAPAKMKAVPSELLEVAEPYALLMHGQEMWPCIKHGAILEINPDGEPEVDHIAIIYLKRSPEEWIARDFVAMDHENVLVRKYGRDISGTALPHAEEMIPWSTIDRICPVVSQK